MLGLIAFFIALLVLVLVHEFGHFAAARFFGVAVEEFGFGFPPRAWAKRFGQTVYSLNWLPLGGFVKIKGEDEAVPERDSFSAQASWKRATIIVAGIVMNLVLAVFLLTIGYGVGVTEALDQKPSPSATVRNIEHRVIGVLPDSPAATVLLPDDRILSLDGQSFTSRAEFQDYVRAHASGSIRIDYRRDDEARSASLQPAVLRPADEPVYGFGVELVTAGTVSYAWYEAPVVATRTVVTTFGLIGTTLWSVVTDLWQGTTPGLQVAGPIGIAVISSEVATLGFVAYLQFLALLSINLAFVNLLPFPALDGGRLLFIIIEAVRRRPVSSAVEARVHRAGFAVLITLIVLVTIVDIRNFGSIFAGWWGSVRHLFS